MILAEKYQQSTELRKHFNIKEGVIVKNIDNKYYEILKTNKDFVVLKERVDNPEHRPTITTIQTNMLIDVLHKKTFTLYQNPEETSEDRYPHTCEYCGSKCYNGLGVIDFDCSNTKCPSKTW